MFKFIVGSVFVFLTICTFAQETGSSEVRDPTSPLNFRSDSAQQAATHFTLNSILVSPQRRVAIINGSTVREGQTIPGSRDVKVQKISTRAVVLQQANKTWVLNLAPSVVKRH